MPDLLFLLLKSFRLVCLCLKPDTAGSQREISPTYSDIAALLAGQIGYALAPQVARGAMLGPDQPVILHLLDIPPAAQSLKGVKMELIDAALPLLAG